jgi:hypothetical protein
MLKDTIYMETAATTDMRQDLNKALDTILAPLDARSKDIIARRYGLSQDEPETLESIGRQYGITRERVRQIEANAKKALAARQETLAPIDMLFSDVFATNGGLLTEEYVAELLEPMLGEKISLNLIHFYLEILPGYAFYPKATLFRPHWRLTKNLHPQLEAIVHAGTAALEQAKHPLMMDDVIMHVRQGDLATVSSGIIKAVLRASAAIEQTAFGDWGLTSWAETSPSGVGDKAYAVLRRNSKPEHFRRITEMINEARFDAKKANPQTVHNELIKDSRFVLVGRGLYGLKEWGYITGTVADVLESILKEAAAPMSREELVEQVLKQRLVKKNTILLSLQNGNRFVKTEKNRYTLKD